MSLAAWVSCESTYLLSSSHSACHPASIALRYPPPAEQEETAELRAKSLAQQIDANFELNDVSFVEQH